MSCISTYFLFFLLALTLTDVDSQTRSNRVRPSSQSRVRLPTQSRVNGRLFGLVQRDVRGVERSDILFSRRPQLHTDIRRDLNTRSWFSGTQLQRATAMLNEELNNNRNPLLLNAWNYGKSQKPQYTNEPLKMAAYVYSLEGPFYLYEAFNDAVSAYHKGRPYAEFRYKGLYALLLLSSQPIFMDLYRGVNALIEARKNSYIRFNRFLSASTNMDQAVNFVSNSRSNSGTLIVFRGQKNAAYIAPHSQFPAEEEYLINPDTQYRVIEVTETLPNGRRGRTITLAQVNYAAQERF